MISLRLMLVEIPRQGRPSPAAKPKQFFEKKGAPRAPPTQIAVLHPFLCLTTNRALLTAHCSLLTATSATAT
jgi:hypothetical protein